MDDPVQGAGRKDGETITPKMREAASEVVRVLAVIHGLCVSYGSDHPVLLRVVDLEMPKITTFLAEQQEFSVFFLRDRAWWGTVALDEGNLMVSRLSQFFAERGISGFTMRAGMTSADLRKAFSLVTGNQALLQKNGWQALLDQEGITSIGERKENIVMLGGPSNLVPGAKAPPKQSAAAPSSPLIKPLTGQTLAVTSAAPPPPPRPTTTPRRSQGKAWELELTEKNNHETAEAKPDTPPKAAPVSPDAATARKETSPLKIRRSVKEDVRERVLARIAKLYAAQAGLTPKKGPGRPPGGSGFPDSAAARKFRNSIAPRIDVLKGVRNLLERHAPDAVEMAQEQVKCLLETVPEKDFPMVASICRAIAETPPDELPLMLTMLLDVLRKEIAAPSQTLYPILLAGSDNDFLNELETELEQYGYEAVYATSEATALQQITKLGIRLVVIQGERLASEKSGLVASLRSMPAGAGTHFIIIQDKAGISLPPGLRIAMDADQCLVRPIEPRTVARFIHTRLGGGKGAAPTAQPSPRERRVLLEKPTLTAAYLKLREEVENGSMPTVLGLLVIGEGHDWSTTPAAENAREAVYRRIGMMLRAKFRTTDLLARWDDTTFVVLLPGEEPAGGKCALEKVMDVLLRRRPFVYRDQEFNLSVAGGLVPVEAGMDIAGAVLKARRNLALSQQRGRGRIELPSETTDVVYRKKVLLMMDDGGRDIVRLFVDKEGLQPVVLDPANAKDVNPYGLRYSLVILDTDFAGGRGFEFLESIRNSNQFSRTPLLMLTNSREDGQRAIELGAVASLVKPYSADAFISQMQRLVSRGRSGHDPTLLMVDSDVPMLVFAGSVLCRHGGFRVLLAPSGREGLQRIHDEPVDAILFSVDVTDLAQGDLLFHLREYVQTHPGTKVALVSKPSITININALREPWIRGVLVKPYKLESLVADVAAMLEVSPKLEVDPAHEKLLRQEISHALSVLKTAGAKKESPPPAGQ